MVIIHFEPDITLEQIAAFDPERPETHTNCAFMNTVCMSFARNGYLNCKEMGRSLGMDDRRFSSAFEALTGVRYTEARPKLVVIKAKELARLHPHWGTKRIANELGFRSRGSLWAILPKEIYHKIHPESKAQFLRRMAAEFDKRTKQD